MHDSLEPILPQVPVEGLAVHIARAGLSMGDPAEARLLPDGRVGIFAHVRRRLLGVFPRKRLGYLGHLGPLAGRIVAPALLQGAPLRLRIVQLTPEHLAGSSSPQIEISVWSDARRLASCVDIPELFRAAEAEALIPEPIPDPMPEPEPAPPAGPSKRRNSLRTAQAVSDPT